jgi:hypothetical protein
VIVRRFEDGNWELTRDHRLAGFHLQWRDGHLETEGADGEFIAFMQPAFGNQIAVDADAIGAVEVAGTESAGAFFPVNLGDAAMFAGDFGRANLHVAFGMPADEDDGPIHDNRGQGIGGIQRYQAYEHGRGLRLEVPGLTVTFLTHRTAGVFQVLKETISPNARNNTSANDEVPLVAAGLLFG